MKTIGCILVIMTLWGGMVSGAEMTAEQWYQYVADVEAMFQERAEQVARGEAPPIKCATPILLDLMESRPADVLYKPAQWERRDDLPFTYASVHFFLHYTNTGVDAIYQFAQQTIEPGVPDYIVRAARVLDSVWNHTVGDLNFPAPLSDGDYNGGGNGLLDVYFANLPYVYGATVREEVQPTLPITATAYMFLENDYEGFQGYENNRLNALRVTAAHEFSHASHFAIDVQEVEILHGDPSPAWMEMSATYMEEEHYPSINDYFIYLPFFYKVPPWSLRTGTFQSGEQPDPVTGRVQNWRNWHMYGSVVFPIYLSRRFGPGIIQDIWMGCGQQPGGNWISAADNSIKSISNNTMDLQDAFQEFTVWNFFTKHRDRSGYFPDGAQFDSVNLAARITSYPATVSVSDSAQPDNLGANYIIVENTPGDTLDILFTPDDTQPWGVTIIKYQNNISAPVSIAYVKYDTLIGPIRITDAGSYDKIAIIPAVLGGDALKVDYTLSVRPSGEGILQPNGGEVLFAGQTYQIQWYFESVTDDFLIELSTDGGNTWSQVTITSNRQSYDWIVPDVSSEECLIRISAYPSMDPSDVSGDVFSIRAVRVFDPFPNPAWPDMNSEMYFKAKGSSSEITVAITTISGELIRELTERSDGVVITIEGDVIVPWDFTNESGEAVAAGPYIAIIRFEGDDPVLKKFVVLR